MIAKWGLLLSLLATLGIASGGVMVAGGWRVFKRRRRA